MNVTVGRLLDYIEKKDWSIFKQEVGTFRFVTWVLTIIDEKDLNLLTGGEMIVINRDITKAGTDKMKRILKSCLKNNVSGIIFDSSIHFSKGMNEILYEFSETQDFPMFQAGSSVNVVSLEKRINEYILRMKNMDIIEESVLSEFLFEKDKKNMMSGVERFESYGLDPRANYQIGVFKATMLTDEQDNMYKEQYVYQAMIMEIKKEKWRTFSMHYGRLMVVLLLVHPDDRHASGNKQLLEKCWNTIKNKFSNTEFKGTLGRICSPIVQIKTSFDEAIFVLNMFKVVDRSSPIIKSYYDIGFYQILRTTHNKEEFVTYYNERMKWIEDYDDVNGSELQETLWCYLENDCNLNNTAAALYVHINTLRYRFTKIEELTEMSLKSTVQLYDFYTCYYIKHYMGINNDDKLI